jgi:hypothetical protein
MDSDRNPKTYTFLRSKGKQKNTGNPVIKPKQDSNRQSEIKQSRYTP